MNTDDYAIEAVVVNGEKTKIWEIRMWCRRFIEC